jgi:hypothetical protein
MSLYFFFVLPPCQKKVLCLSSIFVVVLGIRHSDIWYVKEPDMFELIRVVLPA